MNTEIKSTNKKPKISKKVQKVIWTNEDTHNKKLNSSDSSVSVFTRTTNPKVIIKSENIENSWKFIWKGILDKHRLLRFIWMIIMCLIILITFFLSLKTYNTVNELSEYLMS